MGNKKSSVTVSERVIEDIFVTNKHILAEILSMEYGELSLFARQKVLPSGILDLLYIWKDDLLLIELKTVPFYESVIEQIEGYYQDLHKMQMENRLIKANIIKYIIVPSASAHDIKLCNNSGIHLVIFDMKLVLTRYYESIKELTSFLNIKSGDYGVVRLGLLNSTLHYLSNGKTVSEISVVDNRSEKTIRNRLSIATQIGLITKVKNNFYLTELGAKFVELSKNIDDRLNEQQKTLLREFISSAPFHSQITYTIFSMVESVFVLSKTSYPVPGDILSDYFVKSVGKTTTWNADKTKRTASYIFSNYTIELDLLTKVNNEFFLTPNGIRAVLLMQLHRSIKLIESSN